MDAYVNEDWRDVLAWNGLADFDALWRKDAGRWYEPPNRRRGGWSGVVKTALPTRDGQQAWVFIKRQENHAYRSIRHGFWRAATFEREFFNIQRFRRWGIPTLEPVFFQQQRVDGKLRAILVTASLEGYVPLDDPVLHPDRLSPAERGRLFTAVGGVVSALHARSLQHGSLYAKHILVRKGDAAFDARLIDLEKVRRRVTPHGARERDFRTFHRHLVGWSLRQELRLFRAGLGGTLTRTDARQLLRAIARHARRTGR